MLLKILICLGMGYCFGCFSTAYVIGRANNIDIRQYGSGNAGTTNALRTLGWRAGLLTFLGDAMKAIIPILLVYLVLYTKEPSVKLLALYAGLGVVLGHNFPFWLHFKGGKGIAATAGVMLAFDLRLGLLACAVFCLIVLITRYVSLGSLLISLLFPIWVLVLYTGNIHMLIVSGIFTISAFIKHQSNLKRLISGTENKLGQKVKVK
ncbi:glycerol-3-phosphate acyltransferase [Anaerocolumna cellulosilytica]|uniref:Glycerol-3-phosphate acyltransferase n=1 Tax=Anaerocolumna cellulosilytica TaxID=433286 RepID=A0A6S6R727_9FIRM|nr:glycerol-3-phosphate 1-O-acyltransferase PlsY [Anaerocolumna cellulosilytica]MBB5198057.1 glycerol-3-phosphate acyltransferase PlsY [Anaerocolumna cellulosilytica]BCJ95075.1 glycerol-3-phosphate acyltransferase [Anaerocolumna cellulosilytica]